MDTSAVTLPATTTSGVSSGLVVPVLEGVQSLAGMRGGSAVRARFALCMIDAGIAPASLLGQQPDPAKFISRAFGYWLEQHGCKQIDRRFFLAACIVDEGNYDGTSSWHYLQLRAQQAGYAAWGTFFDAAGAVHRRLPATVWSAFLDIGGLYRAYDYDDAREFMESRLEGMSDEDRSDYLKENRLSHFKIEPPAWIARRVTVLSRDEIRILGRRWPDRMRTIARAALDLRDAAAQVPAFRSESEEWRAAVDKVMGSMPVPVFLSVFKHRDSVAAAFDDESQYMWEDEPSPNVCVPILKMDANGVRQAFSRFARHLDVFRCASVLLDAIPSFRRYAARASAPDQVMLEVPEENTPHMRSRGASFHTVWDAAGRAA